VAADHARPLGRVGMPRRPRLQAPGVWSTWSAGATTASSASRRRPVSWSVPDAGLDVDFHLVVGAKRTASGGAGLLDPRQLPFDAIQARVNGIRLGDALLEDAVD